MPSGGICAPYDARSIFNTIRYFLALLNTNVVFGESALPRPPIDGNEPTADLLLSDCTVTVMGARMIGVVNGAGNGDDDATIRCSILPPSAFTTIAVSVGMGYI